MTAPVTYTCAVCHGVFVSGWSEEESEAEMRENFGDIPINDRAVLCDYCHRDLMVWVEALPVKGRPA